MTVIERKEKSFEEYRNAAHRELHPNIIFWPEQRPTPTTALPFLNWAQGKADEIVEALRREWEESFQKKVSYINGRVINAEDKGDVVKLDLASGDPIECDICVLAAGYESERKFGQIQSPGYWSPSSVCSEENRVLVSGTGDGGLIDALSAIFGIKVTRAAHALAVSLQGREVCSDVKEVERIRSEKSIDDGRDSSEVCDFYERFRLPTDAAASVDQFLEPKKRLDGVDVTLVHSSTSAYSYSSAPINKLLLSHVAKHRSKAIRIVSGSLEEESGAHFLVDGSSDKKSIDKDSDFEKVIVRHGAAPAISSILSEDQLRSLQQAALDHGHAKDLSVYDRDVFKWTTTGMGRTGASLKLLQRSARSAIASVGKVYEITIEVGSVRLGCFTDNIPIDVWIEDPEERERAERLNLFPMKVGPAEAVLKRSSIRRGEAADDAA